MNTWNRISRVSFGLLFFIALVSDVYGQRVNNYTMTNFTATWADISATGTPFQFWDFEVGDAYIPLPFDFPYDDSMMAAGSSIDVSADGGIALFPDNYNFIELEYNSTIDANYWQSIFGDSTKPNVLCFFNTLLADGENDNSTFHYYQVDGTAPSRVFTIQVNDIYFPGTGVDNGNGPEGLNRTNIQVKLYETTGVIEFIYRDHNNYFGDNIASSFAGASIGLNGVSTPFFSSNTYATGLTSTPATDIRWEGRPVGKLLLEPKILDFGSLVPGQRDTLCVNAINVGTANSLGPATLHINGFDLIGDPAFSIVSGPAAGDSILAGQSKQYCVQFIAPSVLGGHAGAFGLQTDGLDSGASLVSLTGTAILAGVQYGATSLFHRIYIKLGDSLTQYIPVSSTGTGPLTFNSISVAGLNSDNYYVSHYPQNPLPLGVSDSIGITFTPMMEGRPDAVVIITTDAVNIPRDSVALFGVGILPHLMVTPSQGSHTTLSFDSVSIGDSVCETIALFNPGTDTLRLKGQFESGDPDFTFYPLMGSDTMIIPGQTKLVNVCFKPLQRGTRLASLRFYTNIPLTYDNPRRDTSQFGINIVGTGVPSGQLVFSGPLPDSAEVGKHICVVDTVMNVGSAPITITNVTITGPNASEFSINGIPPLPFSFPVGLKAMNQICFSPLARGLRTANLLITVEAAGREITETIPLMGHGLEVCASANPAPATFGASGKTLVGRMDTTVITITNCGDVATAYTATASPSTYTLVGSATSASVAPNGTASYTVVFAPTAVGAVSGTLSFTGGLPTSIPLNGVGAGVTATATGSAGSVGKGACQNFDVTITNTGNVDWNAGTPTIAGANASDYTIVSGPTPNPIPAGGTATVTIKFCPSIVGSETATLTFPSGSPSPIGGFSYALTGIGVVNGVSEQSSDRGFELGQSYPNPTTGSAVVMFTLPTDAPVRIDLVDAKGSIVRTVFTGRMTSGDHSVTLDAKDLASGTYFYTLTSGDIHLSRQMTLVR